MPAEGERARRLFAREEYRGMGEVGILMGDADVRVAQRAEASVTSRRSRLPRARTVSLSALQGVERAQPGEAREVAIGRAQRGPVLDRQRGQGGIGDERARDLGAVQQLPENVPVALARIGGRNRR
jgi:hypothetical protein